MGKAQLIPLKRKRMQIVNAKDLPDSHIVYQHCCTSSELDAILDWLHGIPLNRLLATRLQEREIVFPNKRMILECPVSEKEAALPSPTSSTKNSEVLKRKKLKMMANTGADSEPPSDSKSLALIQQPNYQRVNLRKNNIIYERIMIRKLPKDVAATWNIIRNSLDVKDGRDITPTMKKLTFIQHTGAEGANSVIHLLQNAVFSTPQSPLMSIASTRFRSELVPNKDADNPVSTPWPDLTYAYDGELAFSSAQRQILSGSSKLTVNKSSTATFPLLIVEFKGNNPIWIASNQCLGDSAACINLTNTLNRSLERKSVAKIQTTVFSISANAYEAVLHVSWEEGDRYIMKDLDFFHLRRREELLRLDVYVKSILKWGKKQRLNEIQTALDLLR